MTEEIVYLTSFDDILGDGVPFTPTEDPIPDPPQDPPTDPPQDPPTGDDPDPDPDPSPDPDPDSDPEDDEEIIKAHVSFLKEYGVVDEDVTSLEEAKAKIHEQAVNSLVSKLPQEFLPILEFALSSPQADVKSFMELQRSSLSLDELDVNKVDHQKQIIKTFYKETTRHSDDKINRLIDALDEDSLKEEAVDALTSLKTFYAEEQEALAEEAKEAEQARKKEFETFQNKIKDSLSTIDEKRAKLAYNFILSPIKADDRYTTRLNYTLSSILKNPQHVVQLADLLLEYTPEKGITTTRIEQKVKSKATESLRTLVDKQLSSERAKSRKTATPPKQTFNWGNFLNNH